MLFRSDVLPLAEFFLEQHDPALQFSAAAHEHLLAYHWPGNVRELRNAVVKAALEAEGAEILPSHLPLGLRPEPCNGNPLPMGRLDDIERRMILEALSQANGHHERAAAMLGISSRTLSRKLKTYRMGHVAEPISA